MSQTIPGRGRLPVHPHARGDNVSVAYSSSSFLGSPPRPWGQWDRRAVRVHKSGSPPRPWGQFSASGLNKAKPLVHPHARGDNRLKQHQVATGGRFTPTPVGTMSQTIPGRGWWPVHPHARGDNVAAWNRTAGAVRFTPTPVGTISVAPPRARCAPVHPHARGDNQTPFLSHSATGGSPPRPWGQLRRCFRLTMTFRFTPTPVGTIATNAANINKRPVHPHARGDNHHGKSCRSCMSGSPPRPWGQYALDEAQPLLQRFTPTPVGTIGRRGRSPRLVPVHPHARGDNLRTVPSMSARTGSPPRPWGQYELHLVSPCLMRFTPTPVGTIPSTPHLKNASTVHPHARGDNVMGGSGRRQLRGSPPRPWGQLAGRREGC